MSGCGSYSSYNSAPQRVCRILVAAEATDDERVAVNMIIGRKTTPKHTTVLVARPKYPAVQNASVRSTSGYPTMQNASVRSTSGYPAIQNASVRSTSGYGCPCGPSMTNTSGDYGSFAGGVGTNSTLNRSPSFTTRPGNYSVRSSTSSFNYSPTYEASRQSNFSYNSSGNFDPLQSFDSGRSYRSSASSCCCSSRR